MKKYIGILALLALTTSCTEFLEENARVLVTARVVDELGQPQAGVLVRVFKQPETDFDSDFNISGQLGEAVSNENGQVNLTSFTTESGSLSIVFINGLNVANSAIYNVEGTAAIRNAAINLGDVVFLEKVSVEVRFVNTSMPSGTVPFDITFQQDNCRVFVDQVGGANTLVTRCYEQTSRQVELQETFTANSIFIKTLSNTNVTINYEINGTVFTETVLVNNQNSFYEINY